MAKLHEVLAVEGDLAGTAKKIADEARTTFDKKPVDAYPTTVDGAVQHNAWWDAMALRAKIES